MRPRFATVPKQTSRHGPGGQNIGQRERQHGRLDPMAGNVEKEETTVFAVQFQVIEGIAGDKATWEERASRMKARRASCGASATGFFEYAQRLPDLCG